MPKASIVIPCYNAEKHLRETLSSVLAQTEADFEVLCIDNRSTDSTAAILEEYALRDSRLQILREEEPGEGPARDTGLRAAQGEWIYCLDSDDIMRPTLLEEAIATGANSGADVVVFRVEELDEQTGEVRPCPKSFITDWLPEGVTSFNPQHHPERVLNSFQYWVHNKLVRGSFLKENEIHVQHLHRAADVLFTSRILCEARLITLLDRPLHLYRVNNPTSAISTTYRYPLDFYYSRVAFKECLESRGTWDVFRDSFINSALEGCALNLYFCETFESFREIALTLKKGGFARLGIEGYPRERAYINLRWDQCKAIAELPLDELAFYYLLLEKHHNRDVYNWLSNADMKAASLEEELRDIRESRSYRVVSALAKPLRLVNSTFTRSKRRQ